MDGIQVKPKSSPEQVCGFCRDVFAVDDALHTCERCSQGFHEECFQEELQGRCVTIGCDGYRPPLRQRISLIRARRRVRRRRARREGSEQAGRRQGLRSALLASLAAAGLGYWVLSGASFEALIWLLIVPLAVVFAVVLKRGA